MELLQGLDLLIIDALRYTPHDNHFNIEGALRVVETLRPKRAVLTHLTHEVPYADGARLPEGVEFLVTAATAWTGCRVPGSRTATAMAAGNGLIDWAVTVAAALP